MTIQPHNRSVTCNRDHSTEPMPGAAAIDQTRAAALILGYLSEDEQSPSVVLGGSGECIDCARGVAWAAAGIAGSLAERHYGDAETAIARITDLAVAFQDAPETDE